MQAEPIIAVLAPKKDEPIIVKVKCIEAVATIYKHQNGGYDVVYYDCGRRKRPHFPDLDTAKEKAREFLKAVASGATRVAPFSPKETAILQTAIERAGGIAVLFEAADHYAESKQLLGDRWTIAELRFAGIKALESAAPKTIKFPDLVEEFVAF